MATNKAAAGVASNDLDTPLHIAAKYVVNIKIITYSSIIMIAFL